MAFTVKTINTACVLNKLGKGFPNVYARTMPLVSDMCFSECKMRITQARTFKGQLQGKSLASGKWVNIVETIE
jgi:hypothetical protein